MTVISAILSKSCIAIASDSLITTYDKTNNPLEYGKSKIVYYEKLKCSASYWGLAWNDHGWSTYDWLEKQKSKSAEIDTLENFANYLRDSLDKELSKMNYENPVHKGIGIHLVGYEKIDDKWIPELFLICNYDNTNYSELREKGLGVSRETYGTVTKYLPELKNENYSDKEKRLVVYNEFLNKGRILFYNNGDPIMFNPIAKAFLQFVNTTVASCSRSSG